MVFVHVVMNGFGLRIDLKIIASGKVSTAFDIIKMISMQAYSCNRVCAMIMAAGCKKSLRYHIKRCPTDIAALDATLNKELIVEFKIKRVTNFH